MMSLLRQTSQEAAAPMPKVMTISISDEAYDALRSVGEKTNQSPEELAAAAITERFSARPTAEPPYQWDQQARDDFLALMRIRGYLVQPGSLHAQSAVADLPAAGSTERAAFEEEIGDALSDALEQSGLSILDLIERR